MQTNDSDPEKHTGTDENRIRTDGGEREHPPEDHALAAAGNLAKLARDDRITDGQRRAAEALSQLAQTLADSIEVVRELEDGQDDDHEVVADGGSNLRCASCRAAVTLDDTLELQAPEISDGTIARVRVCEDCRPETGTKRPVTAYTDLLETVIKRANGIEEEQATLGDEDIMTDGGVEIETGSAASRLIEARKQSRLAARELDEDLAAEAHDIAVRVEWVLCELEDVQSIDEVRDEMLGER